MKLFKLMVLLISLSAAGLCKTTHAESVAKKNNDTIAANKENKTVIELNKDITVNTGLNLDTTLANLKGTEASNVPKVRKVTPVDNDSLERKTKPEVKAADYATEQSILSTATAAPAKMSKILTEAGVVDIKVPAKNDTDNVGKKVVEKKVEDKTSVPPLSATLTSINSNKTETALINSKNTTEVVRNQDKNSNTEKVKTNPLAAVTTTTTPISLATKKLDANNDTSTVVSKITSAGQGSSNSTSATTSSTTTTATTTTTTTTTPKPKKPTITYSIPDFPDLEKDNPELKNLLQSSAAASKKLPLPDGPYAQPSQEFNNNPFNHGRDFILPIVSMIFIIPLVIGILITSYRRFRDCWSTRHYRRMDFLVDGMYND